MRVTIKSSDGIVLDYEGGEANVLVPQNTGERAGAFHALVGALALLAGVMPQASSGATEAARDEHSGANERCQDGHSSGVVLRLVTQPAD